MKIEQAKSEIKSMIKITSENLSFLTKRENPQNVTVSDNTNLRVAL